MLQGPCSRTKCMLTKSLISFLAASYHATPWRLQQQMYRTASTLEARCKPGAVKPCRHASCWLLVSISAARKREKVTASARRPYAAAGLVHKVPQA